MSTDLTVDRFMQRELLECSRDTPIGEAARLMREAHRGSIIVVEDGKPIGIWTETDAIAGGWQDPGVLQRPIDHFMSQPVLSVAPGMLLGEAAVCFQEHGVRHLLVIDGAGRRLGMISQTDVVRHQGVEFFVHVREVGSVIRESPVLAPADQPFSVAIAGMRSRRQDALVVARNGDYGILTSRDVLRVISEGCLDACVGEVASFPLITIRKDASLFQARDLFTENHIRHLGVVNAEGRLVGLLGFRDILEGVGQEYLRELRTELAEQTKRLRSTEGEVRRQTHLTAAILDALPITVTVQDETGRLVVVNEMAARTFGRQRAELEGCLYTELFPPEQARRLYEEDLRLRASLQTAVHEETMPDGRILVEHKKAVDVGGRNMLIGASIDVTDWRRADALMVSGHHVLELIAGGAEIHQVLDAICLRIETHLAGARCSIILLDADGRHLSHGSAPSLPTEYGEAIQGLRIGPTVGSCGAAIFRGEQVIVSDVHSNPLWANFREFAQQFGFTACWSTPFFNPEHQAQGSFAIYFDTPRTPTPGDLVIISYATRLTAIAVERWQQLSKLKRMATVDQLTGLANRAHFLERAREEIRRAQRFGRHLALVMIDLDHFKQINDRHGHATGDETLRVFSELLRSVLRTVDLPGRLGGEEFGVVLPEADLDAAHQAIERLRQAVAARNVVTPGQAPVRFTLSAGVAAVQSGESIERLMARADAALYRAKASGRNRVEIADDSA